MEKNEKKHRISFSWYKVPYIINTEANIGEKLQVSLLKKLQDSVFYTITETMFTAHKVKMKKEDKKKESFEIFIDGSLEECNKLKGEFDNLHQLDFSKALRKIPFMYRKKVAQSAEELSKFEKLQENLARFGIYLEVSVNEL